MRTGKIRLPHTLVLIYAMVIWVIFGLLTLIPPVLMRWGPF